MSLLGLFQFSVLVKQKLFTQQSRVGMAALRSAGQVLAGLILLKRTGDSSYSQLCETWGNSQLHHKAKLGPVHGQVDMRCLICSNYRDYRFFLAEFRTYLWQYNILRRCSRYRVHAMTPLGLGGASVAAAASLAERNDLKGYGLFQ